jgi:diaminopimelate decarboxylase
LASKLISEYGSPLYVYRKDKLLSNVREVQQAAHSFHISYAMKANSNPEILKAIQDNGKGIMNVDVVSPG